MSKKLASVARALLGAGESVAARDARVVCQSVAGTFAEMDFAGEVCAIRAAANAPAKTPPN